MREGEGESWGGIRARVVCKERERDPQYTTKKSEMIISRMQNVMIDDMKYPNIMGSWQGPQFATAREKRF